VSDSELSAAPEPPPPLGSWGLAYALVLLDLVVVIALCGWLSSLGS
jgi:hypothetical protein